MSLLDKIMQAKSNEPPCQKCKHLIFSKPNLPFCEVVDKIILIDYPPNSCELREVEG